MLEIEVDRSDRRYHFGEPVSGRVLVHVKRELERGTKVWVSWTWRTHGRGNSDHGRQEKLQLSQDYTTFPVGKTVVFPFRLKLPHGPASYHGHNLKVDWYVTASLTHPAFLFFKWDQRMLKVEQDFLLLGGRTRGPVVLGFKQISQTDIPGPLSGRAPDPAGLVEIKPRAPAVGIPLVEWEKAILAIAPFAALLFLHFALNTLWGPAGAGSYRTPAFVRRARLTAQAAVDTVSLDLMRSQQVSAVSIRIDVALRHIAEETFAGWACPQRERFRCFIQQGFNLGRREFHFNALFNFSRTTCGLALPPPFSSPARRGNSPPSACPPGS